jgi:uncharacterized BrkB/YihY/UPF0761 family membrane protein
MKARINTAALSVDLVAGLTSALVNIPQAMAHAMPALAGLVIVAGVQMFNVNASQTIWQTNPVSRTITLITFGSTLVMPLQYAVLLGVAISILLSVFQQSNTLHIVEWAIQESGWPVEQPAPSQLESGRVTAPYVYGNLFYAAATTIVLLILVGLTVLCFALIYELFPDVQLSWQDVWLGAGIAALLETIGFLLIGFFTEFGIFTSASAAAGSVAMLLIISYYMAQIFLLGAVITRVYTNGLAKEAIT